MANFDVSNLLTAQQILKDKYAKPEMRMKPAPVFELLSKNDSVLYQSVETLRTREDRAIEAHLLKRTKRTAGSARAHNHTGTIDDSQKITLAWTIKSDVTSISLKLLDKSVFDFNTVLANKLEQCAMNILEDKETEAVAYLMAQRATANPTLKGSTFNVTPDAVEISLANQATFFQRLRSAMKQNYFSGSIDAVVDSNLKISAEYQAAQGAANSTNTAFQFQGVNIIESIELNDADYAAGCALAFPTGAVAALNWIPKQNRQGYGDYSDYNGGYGTFEFMGFTFALHGYASRADTSASNGATQDVLMEFELSLDSSFNKAPISTISGRTDSVIIEFGQLAA
jgi:hypothetical protein